MTSERFVGRTAELAELRAALEEAIGSRPSLALLGGESGVGKSRLADELARHAREAGARVLSGDCVELGEDELPYAPLLTALRPLVRQGDPSLQALAPQLRSALDAILPGVGGGASSEHVPQSTVFEALLAVLQALAEEEPVLLLIEDLHWADSSTRSFIGFLSRTMCSERLLIVGTYRSDELHRRHPLRPLLAELGSDPYTRLIELPRFTREELGEQLEGIMADPPRAELVERVYARSEGNAPHGGTAVFRVDDLDLAKTALEQRGVAFHEHLGEVPGIARYASFDDPDGNSMQLIEYVPELG